MFLKENIIGIVAEYNPFHNGHLHHISQSRLRLDASYVIVVMSGDFVQRGMPAIYDKYIRTRMALLNGADLVIELPVCYALASAEGFARGSISLLDSLKAVTHLSFGSEAGSIAALSAALEALSEDSESSKQIKELLRNGLSYPKAVSSVLGSGSTICEPSPNNILSIEYLKSLKALNSPIIPYTLKREDNGYNSTSLNMQGTMTSASSIRADIGSGKQDYYSFIPENIRQLFSDTCVTINAFSDILYYRLSGLSAEELTEYSDVSFELGCKIVKNLKNYRDIEGFLELLKSKNLTYARISRSLFHILLGITDDLSKMPPSYARILGFRKASASLLGLLKESSNLPLISKLADAASNPSLELDIKAANLYEQVAGKHQNEYSREIVIL